MNAIYIENNETALLPFDEELVDIEFESDKLYEDYRMTELRFKIETKNSVKIHIPYRQRLTHIEAKYATLCRWDNNQWEQVNFTHDSKNKEFIFETNQSGNYAIFKNVYWYSSFTQKLANEYPRWTRIRKTNKSYGQQFLNFFGIQFEELKEWLDWIDGQKHLATADIHVLDWVYVYPLPSVAQEDDIRIFHQDKRRTNEIPIVDTLKEFFYNEADEGGIIDYEERKFYSRKRYEQIRGIIRNENGIKEFKAEPTPFHIWNTFDEFGLLLNKRRYHLETNTEFKERLLDVFRYPANSSKQGLTHGIAQELQLINRTQTWKDDTKPFIIYNKSGWPIDINSLRVDYQPLDEEQFDVIDQYHIVIHPLHQYKKHTVSFIYGIKMYELHDKSNKELYQMIYHPNGHATSKLMYWASYINTVAPIMWGDFRWDEGFWDTVSKELSGLGYIPNIWDSDISKWKEYKFLVNRWEDEQIWM